MSVFKRGNVWWYRFRWNSEEIRESTKQSNKRIAEQMEAAHKTSLAKGEVGLREKKKAPTLRQFLEERFMPFVETHHSDKPATIRHYFETARSVAAFEPLSALRLDEILPEHIASFIAHLKEAKHSRRADARPEEMKPYQVSSMNRQLSTLRRAFRLAEEWELTGKVMPKVRLLPGENRRERVLAHAEEEAYLAAARSIGEKILADYEAAQSGIRATQRGETPIQPRDPFLLHDLAVILLDCGLRPEEGYRLRFDEVKDGALHIAHGKSKNARRTVPASDRAKALLEWRRQNLGGEWVFPALTSRGHADQSTIRIRHEQACEMAKIPYFVVYTFRHTRLTRWAATMDPFTLAYLAGHSDMSTTRRYVHVQMETIRAAVEKAERAETTHKSGHSQKTENSEEISGRRLLN